MVIIVGSVLGGSILLIFLCCLCGSRTRDYTKSPTKNEFYQKSSKFVLLDIEYITHISYLQLR